MMPFQRTCKEVAALVIAKEDRPLSWDDRLALRLHMSACKTCPIFQQQILTMRYAMQRWRDPEHEEASEAHPSNSNHKG